MTELTLAVAVFLVLHIGMSSTPLRGLIARRLGETAFLGLFSTTALLALAWMVTAYAAAPFVELWPPAVWLNAITLVLMAVSVALVVGSLSPSNAAIAGRSLAIDDSVPVPPAAGALRITRHPMLWGIGLWALGHVLPNGDLASLLLFGPLGALAVAGTWLIDRKTAARRPAVWRQLQAETSVMPFGAILAGRQSLRLAAVEYGAIRLGIAALVFAALFAAHPWLSGGTAVFSS